jgi:RNase P subunit RPR2
MKPQVQYVCPRCDHLLVPVHSVEGRRRQVIALTCPEPYCGHVQCLPRDRSRETVESTNRHLANLRRAN